MTHRSLTAGLAALVVLIGCRDDSRSPLEPGPVRSEADLAAPGPLTFWQVSSGDGHTCGVTTENRAYCWGHNGLGQLGAGSQAGSAICLPFELPQCQPRPVAVVGGLLFRNVSAGVSHTCGIAMDDKAYCWGYNGWGQLGDGTTSLRTVPTPVAGGLTWRQISAGGYHTCGRTTANTVYCWGLNTYGELGDGTQVQRLLPTRVAGSHKFRMVGAGLQHSCAISTTDETYCWGNNRNRQVGDSSTALRRVRPVRVAGGLAFRELDAGYLHTCAVTYDDKAYCWGDGTLGAVGDGGTALRSTPRAVKGGFSFTRVTAGSDLSCGQTTGKRAYCWGANVHGEIGDGTTIRRLTPAAVSLGLLFGQISAGLHTCAKTDAGLGYCWGRNDSGELGVGDQADRYQPTPVLGPS